MLHGRSRLQRYSKLSDWDYIQSCGSSLEDHAVSTGSRRVPLVGNGDIFSYRDYQERRRENVLDCAMIGRGALIKPWLPTEIKESRDWDISSSERLEMLRKFVDYGLEHWGSDLQGVERTRRFMLEWLSFLWRYVPVGLISEGRTLPRGRG